MFIREVLFLFILCGLFFIILFLLYIRVRELVKENEILRDIIRKGSGASPKGDENDSRPPEETRDV